MSITLPTEARFRLFLNRCKSLALEKTANNFWRFEKYIDYLDKIFHELQLQYEKVIDENVMETYRKDVAFLKGVVEAEKLTNIQEKLASAQKLVATANTDDTNEIGSLESSGQLNLAKSTTSLKQVKALTTAQYVRDMRKQLLGINDKDDNRVGLRLRKAGDALETNNADIDAVVKHHHDVQERLADQFLQLTRNLKEHAAAAGVVIREDRKVLDRVNVAVDKNTEELAKEAERLIFYAYKSCDWWVWGMLLLVCCTFIGMVLLMRIFPKPVS